MIAYTDENTGRNHTEYLSNSPMMECTSPALVIVDNQPQFYIYDFQYLNNYPKLFKFYLFTNN